MRDAVYHSISDHAAQADRGAVSPKGFELSARRIGRLMRDTFNLGFVDVGGWDTHVNQGAGTGYLADRLGELGRGLSGFVEEIGPGWSDTVVVVLSEFGRTFRENGNRGTDHGHGSVYWILGGGVRGGRIAGPQVRADEAHLFQNRDYPGPDRLPRPARRAVPAPRTASIRRACAGFSRAPTRRIWRCCQGQRTVGEASPSHPSSSNLRLSAPPSSRAERSDPGQHDIGRRSRDTGLLRCAPQGRPCARRASVSRLLRRSARRPARETPLKGGPAPRASTSLRPPRRPARAGRRPARPPARAAHPRRT